MDKQKRVCYHNIEVRFMAEFEIVIDNIAVFADGENDVQPSAVAPISFSVDGKTLKEVDPEAILEARKAGKRIRTQVVPKDTTLLLEGILASGKDVLFISVSSALSESFHTADYIAKGLAIKFPERKIIVIDSLACGGSEGLLFLHAKKLQNAGLSIDEIAEELNAAKNILHHTFITDDTSALTNDGVIAQTSVVNLTPIFELSKDGQISVLQKTMGKKKVLSDVVKYVTNTLNDNFCSSVVITYGNEEWARKIADDLTDKAPALNIKFAKANNYTSSYIGSHAVSVCFFGETRKRT